MKSRARQQPAVKASPGRTAVMYVRVSSKEQEQGFSIPAQRQLLNDYAEREGIHVVQEFEDVETAKRAGRTSFTEMVDFLRKKTSGCRTLLVEKTDRLYRNIKDWVTIDELGIEVHFVKEAVVLSEDSRSSEKFMHGIKVLMAKNYIDNLGEEVRKGMIEKARQVTGRRSRRSDTSTTWCRIGSNRIPSARRLSSNFSSGTPQASTRYVFSPRSLWPRA